MSDCKSPGTIGCQQVVDYSMDYLEGALPDHERRHFQDHLDQCPECVNFFQTYQQTPAVSRECLAVQMPTTVKDAVLSFLRGRCPR